MTFLIVDTETTGLPTDWTKDWNHPDTWPRMVELAYQVINVEFSPSTKPLVKLLDSFDSLVLPEGYEIPKNAVEVHGITTQDALNEGRQLPYVLDRLVTASRLVDYVVAYNMEFDENVIFAEFYRTAKFDALNYFISLQKFCLMNACTKYYGKRVSLRNAYYDRFKEHYPAHRALADVEATKRLLVDLLEKRFIILPTQYKLL